MGSIPMITRTVAEIAELCGATLEGDGERTIVGPAALEDAVGNEVSFLGNARYVHDLESTAAGAVIVPLGVEIERKDLTLLWSKDANRAFSSVIEVFQPTETAPVPGVHPSAVIDADVVLGDGVSIGPLVHVGEGSVLGAGVVLHPGVSVGSNCTLGDGSVLHANVSLYAGTILGQRCCVHAGTVLGSDGFGYEPTARGWDKVPQCGSVLLEDDVEIGANCTIDRGRFAATRILRDTKIDNLVHVAHNVVVGPAALLIAQVGISGSARLGQRVIVAGQAGINGHVRIADGARIGGRAGVSKDITEAGDYLGYPATTKVEHVRARRVVRRLPELLRRLEKLEKRLTATAGDELGPEERIR